MNRSVLITDLKELEHLNSVSVKTANACEQCGRCGSVCLAVFKKPNPTSLIRLVQLGSLFEALRSPLLWSCIGCEQCKRVCPNQLDVVQLVRSLRRLSAMDREACFPKYIMDMLMD